MVDGPKTVRYVRVEHPVGPPVGLDPDRLTGHPRRPLRSKPKALGQEVGLENWFEDDLGCRHDHPIAHSRDTQRTSPPVGFRNVHPPKRNRPVHPGLQRLCELGEELPHPGALHVGDGNAVDARSTPVSGHVTPSPPQDVAAGDLVEEGMEAAPAVLLGTAIQHPLTGSNRIHALGVTDGPSRCLGPHQGSSPPQVASMKQGPFAQAGLCCPGRRHYYDPLRLPLARMTFPGVAGYSHTRSAPPQGPGRGGPLQFPPLPSDRSTLSYAGEFLASFHRSGHELMAV